MCFGCCSARSGGIIPREFLISQARMSNLLDSPPGSSPGSSAWGGLIRSASNDLVISDLRKPSSWEAFRIGFGPVFSTLAGTFLRQRQGLHFAQFFATFLLFFEEFRGQPDHASPGFFLENVGPRVGAGMFERGIWGISC